MNHRLLYSGAQHLMANFASGERCEEGGHLLAHLGRSGRVSGISAVPKGCREVTERAAAAQR